ncbi:SMI1/KNR4 family protein [Brevibacillus sp. SYSU BS000544]|uniref:SMI1/KNR4 family protein n=1 Tax=Brevibacillus sp. SYSU BS000544 TaxID=3416443 RepID=UPI003CE50D2F
MNRFDQIRQKLDYLKELDARYKVFYSKRHRYQFNPVLTKEEIQLFENKYAISLPEDYRDFLMNVGNGGAGPSYGLIPLVEYNDVTDEPISHESLAKPFPYTSDWKNHDDEEDLRENDRQGTITLCDHGCGVYHILVISGPEKGKVWYDARCDGYGMGRVANSFLSWYEDWLDRAIKEIEEHRKVRDIFECTIDHVSGSGYGREVKIKVNEVRTDIFFHYIEHSEFLQPESNEKSRILQEGDRTSICLYIEEPEELNVVKQNKNKYEYLHHEVKSVILVSGEITKIFNDSSLSCFIYQLGKEVLILTSNASTYSVGQLVEIKARLQGEIFKIEKKHLY